MPELPSLPSLPRIEDGPQPPLRQVFEPKVEQLTPDAFEELEERYGDQPEWMRITGYREARHPRSHRRRGELMLNLTGQDYWFPVSPGVYENYVGKIVRESRGAGLRYLQNYIRTYREYKERWPSKRYVRRNQLHVNSFYPESVQPREPAKLDYPSKLGLSEDVVGRIVEMRRAGHSPRAIARELRISVAHVESTLSLVYGFDVNQRIDDSTIRSIADGEITVEAFVDKVRDRADRYRSRKDLRKFTKQPMKSVHISGMKSGPRVDVTPQTI